MNLNRFSGSLSLSILFAGELGFLGGRVEADVFDDNIEDPDVDAEEEY